MEVPSFDAEPPLDGDEVMPLAGAELAAANTEAHVVDAGVPLAGAGVSVVEAGVHVAGAGVSAAGSAATRM
jgi:hypothetical protein